ncbi:MAG TPA: CHAP domain-containing protein [Vicinamibacterales bacterium]|jgi:surface antigen
MGKGAGATKDLNATVEVDVDDGTSARTDTPAPGPIGLDAHSSGSAHVSPSVTAQVVGYAQHHNGQRIGDGQCFAFADRALSSAGARSASDFGSVSDDVDYVWGTPVSLADLQAGDILQFRDYRYDRTITTDHADGSSQFVTDFQERPHHTAIVESVQANGEVVVLEQNAPAGSAVHRAHLFFTAGTTTSGQTTTTISVQGSFWFYRPQPR